LHTRSGDGVWRVEADAAGEPLWFESPDLPLAASAEAYGSLLLLPAAAHGRRLILPTAVDAAWLANARRALEVAQAWWGYGGRPEEVLSGLTAVPHEAPASTADQRALALCFSGGVDSFHTLLRGDGEVGVLVCVHGFDIPLADTRRMAAMEASLRTIAAVRGLRAVLIRSNLRQHPAFACGDWEQVHGGALAALGHLLRDSVRSLLISASYPLAFDQPWGSHWKLDPLWSSTRTRIEHVGAELWRADKLRAIMDEPLVREHLRVCWENRSEAGNCGACEKCIRTMLILDGAQRLAQYTVFPGVGELAGSIAQLNRLKPDLRPVYASFLDTALSPPVRAAVERLLARSYRPGLGRRLRELWWSWRRGH
jgi:hypothetical protein